MKKLLSLALSVALLLGLLICPAAGEGTADPEPAALLSIDFEDGFTTDMAGSAIKEKLGWTDWDLSVADLKIVETVYFREVNAKVGGTVASDLAAAKAIHAGQTGAYNHVTVDIALLKTLDKYKDVDFTQYATYSKKLAVVPQADAADNSVSVMLAENVPVSNKGLDSLTLDFELTPDYYGTLSDPSTFGSGSSLGLRVSGGRGDLSQSLLITGALRFTATAKDGTETVNSIKADDWYINSGVRTSANGYGGLGTNDTVAVTYKDGEGVGHLFCNSETSTTTMHGYVFAFRTVLTEGQIETYVQRVYGNNAGETYRAGQWVSTAAYRTAEFNAAAAAVTAGTGVGSVSLDYSHSGVGFWLDDIKVVKTVDGNAKEVEILVNGKTVKAVEGRNMAVVSLAPNPTGLLYAVVKNGTSERKLSATDYVTVEAGLEITMYSVDLGTTAASIRPEDPAGIRWTTTIAKSSVDLINSLLAEGTLKKVESGTIITPKSYADKAGGCTMEKLATLNSNYPYLTATATWGKWYAQDNESVTIAGSLVKLRNTETAAHYGMDYTARAFVTLTMADGSAVTIYAAQSEAETVANAAALAQAAVAANELPAESIEAIRAFLPEGDAYTLSY